MDANNDTLLTTRQVSDLTGIAAGTLSNWRAANRGPKHTRLGCSVRYRASDVQAWIDANSVDTFDSIMVAA